MSDPQVLMGYILESNNKYGVEPGYCLRKNDEAIASLPEDDTFPPLYRDMFHRTGADGLHGSFRGERMIFFGGQFNHFVGSFPEWLDKFEDLLRRMHWYAAEAMIVSGWSGPLLRLNYLVKLPSVATTTSGDAPTPTTEWELTCYRKEDQFIDPVGFSDYIGVARAESAVRAKRW